MTTAVYYRVSTDDQTIDMQRVAVEAWIADQKHAGPFKIYEDIGISGAKSDRPAFKKLLSDVEKKRIQAVIVYKLDRLTRDALTGIEVILRFDRLDVRFISVSQPMFSHGTPFRRVMIAIFAELAQMERETIVERIRAGLAAARKRGVKLGAPTKVTAEKTLRIAEMRLQGQTYKQIANAVGLSVGSVHKSYEAYLEAEEGFVNANSA